MTDCHSERACCLFRYVDKRDLHDMVIFWITYSVADVRSSWNVRAVCIIYDCEHGYAMTIIGELSVYPDFTISVICRVQENELIVVYFSVCIGAKTAVHSSIVKLYSHWKFHLKGISVGHLHTSNLGSARSNPLSVWNCATRYIKGKTLWCCQPTIVNQVGYLALCDCITDLWSHYERARTKFLSLLNKISRILLDPYLILLVTALVRTKVFADDVHVDSCVVWATWERSVDHLGPVDLAKYVLNAQKKSQVSLVCCVPVHL